MVDTNEFPESVMIALLPITNDWCRIEVPHMTLVYAGEKKDLKPTAFNELAKDAASIAQMVSPLHLRVTGVEQFGNWGHGEVDVLRLQPTPELWAMRRFVEHWNASEHPFNPHATIGPVGIPLEYKPNSLAFDRICVGWGKEYLTFWLKR